MGSYTNLPLHFMIDTLDNDNNIKIILDLIKHPFPH